MSNVYAIVGNFENSIPSPRHESSYYSIRRFEDLEILPYKDDQADDDEFYPSGQKQAVFFDRVQDLNMDKPSFIEQNYWNDTIKKTASMSISGNGTLMNRMIFPTVAITSNGLVPADESTDNDCQAVFNWKAYAISGGSEIGMTSDNLMEKSGRKNDSEGDNFSFVDMSNCGPLDTYDKISNFRRKYVLNKAEPEESATDYSLSNIIGGGVGGAACAFVLKFYPVHVNKDDKTNDGKITPKVVIEMGDNIEIEVAENGDLVVDINGQKTQGQLTQAKNAQKPGQAKADEKFMVLLVYPVWNGLVISSGIQDKVDLASTSSLYAVKKNDVNIEDYKDYGNSDDKFDYENPEPIEVEYKGDVELDWGSEIRLTWKYCKGAFAYIPAFFTKQGKCSVIFQATNDSGDNTYHFYAYPVYTKNGIQGSIEVNEAEIISGSENETEGTVYRKFQFNSLSDGNYWMRKGLETWGYIQQIKEDISLSVNNGNGTFDISVSDAPIPVGTSWKDYIQNISFSHSLESISGQISVDKYALLGQDISPVQSIGAITIDMAGGENLLAGRIFSGIAYGIGDSVSEGSDDLTINIFGFEKKLQDIRLVNVPFWDGDSVSEVATYLSKYGGIEVSFPNDTGNTLLPATMNIENPYVNFQPGTSVWEALNWIAEQSNHMFVINKEGVGEFHWIDDNGYAKTVSNSPTHSNLTGDVVISYSNTPDFDNLYNKVWTAGIPMQQGNKARDAMPDLSDVEIVPQIETSDVTTTPEIPWQKMLVSVLPGFLPTAKIKENHQIDVKRAQRYMSTGSMQIPGNAEINLFDKVDSGGSTWYVYEISHNIDLSTKTWTTNLSLGLVR